MIKIVLRGGKKKTRLIYTYLTDKESAAFTLRAFCNELS